MSFRKTEGLCFPCENGGPYRGMTLPHRVGRLAEKINEDREKEAVEAGRTWKERDRIDFTLQTLRRTFGTILRLRGVPLDKISKWLGHSSVRITEAWYSDPPLDGSNEAVNALDFRTAPTLKPVQVPVQAPRPVQHEAGRTALLAAWWRGRRGSNP